MPLPQRFDFVADEMAIDLRNERARAEAARKFYSALSPGQRQQFDEAMLPTTGRPGLAADPTPLPAEVRNGFTLPSHTDADWMVKPRGEDMARVYPSLALRTKEPGSVVLSCTADEDGYLTDCVVSNETPPGQGFGNAALEMTAYMRMKPATNFGVPVRSTVNLPVNFAPP